MAGDTVALSRLAMSVSARLFPEELLQLASACSAAISAFTNALFAEGEIGVMVCLIIHFMHIRAQ